MEWLPDICCEGLAARWSGIMTVRTLQVRIGERRFTGGCQKPTLAWGSGLWGQERPSIAKGPAHGTESWEERPCTTASGIQK